MINGARCIPLDSDVLSDSANFLTLTEELTVRLVSRRFNYVFNRPDHHRKLIDDIQALEMCSKTIFNQRLHPKLIKQIKQIHYDYNLEPLYRQKLVYILRSFYFHSKLAPNSSIGLWNLRTLMNSLHILPINCKELSDEELWALPSHIQLLLIMSRSIAHPFVYSNARILSDDRNETASSLLEMGSVDKLYFNYSFGVTNYYGVYPEGFPADYIVFKIIYDHSLEYSTFGENSYLPNMDELTYLNGSRWRQMVRFQFLMDKWHYIPWNLPKVEIADSAMVRSVIHAYDSILDITFTILLADYYFDDAFFIDMHEKFIWTLLENENASFTDLGEVPRLFEVFRDILKRVLVNLVTYPAEFRKVVRMIYERDGELILESLAEFIAACDNGYYYVLMDVLMEIDSEKFQKLNDSDHYYQSLTFSEWCKSRR